MTSASPVCRPARSVMPIDAALSTTARAHSILTSLIENYTPERPEDSDALLRHGVYDLPKDNGVDEGTLWGDYFFLEALVRVTRPDWKKYW